MAEPSVLRLSSLVVRVMGLNPGAGKLSGTNTYLVGAGRRRILVDAGEGRAGYMPALLVAMRDHGCDDLSDVVLTHYHHDHIGGLADLRKHFAGLKAWKFMPRMLKGPGDAETAGFLSVAADPRAALLRLLGLGAGADPGELHELFDGSTLSTDDGSATLRVLATPGHTADHMRRNHLVASFRGPAQVCLGWSRSRPSSRATASSAARPQSSQNCQLT